jgi:lipopolysaccharide transport system ATP-binding protein
MSVRTFKRSNGNNTIWALKDVSFEVKRGEVVGIPSTSSGQASGATGLCAKSRAQRARDQRRYALCSMPCALTRITEPTKGYAEIHGRVGSLLEVGTGFHPELTGRENIYLNGAILGMKAEIDTSSTIRAGGEGHGGTAVTTI